MGKGTPEAKLTPLPVNRSFLWDKQEILIPAVYVGKAGATLDVCAKIPTEDMAAFLTKWDYERLCYDWDGESILSPLKISLAFQANLISITAGHFSTGVSCDGETVKMAHPITRQEYIGNIGHHGRRD